MAVNVLDGTPCGTADEDKICLSSKCVKRPAPPPPPSPTVVNCTGAWSEYGECSAKCGGGKQIREYVIKTQAQNGGTKCSAGDGTKQQRQCNKHACPVDCIGVWSAYSDCSRSCGNGTQNRTYTVKQKVVGNGKDCDIKDKTRQSQQCNTNKCDVKTDCVGSWGEYGSCSAQCGGGNQTRTYSIKIQAQKEGKDCSIKAGATQTQSCNKQACAVDCVGDWGGWGSCDKECGSGKRLRKYEIRTNARNGGQSCATKGGTTQVQECNTNKCAAPCSNSTCLHGRCAAFESQGKLQKYLKCKCEPGWQGTTCNAQFECDKVDCQGLHRQRCIAPNKCGLCASNFSHIGVLGEGKPCTLVTIMQYVIKLSANSKTNFNAAADGNFFSIWHSLYEQRAAEARKPALTFRFESLEDPNLAVATHYAIVSANAHPSEDPKDWKLQCLVFSSNTSTWLTLDTRLNQLFTKRHESKYYVIKQPQPCRAITLRLLGIRDSAYQGGASLTELSGDSSVKNKTSNETTRRNQTTSREIKSYQTKVQLAEVQLWRTVNYKPPLPEASLPAEVTLEVDAAVASTGPTRDKFEAAFIADMASLLSVDKSRIRIDSITVGSIIVKFFILPDSSGKPFTTAALANRLADTNIRVAGSKVSGLQGVSLKEQQLSSLKNADSDTDGTSVKVAFGIFVLILTLIAGVIIGLILFSGTLGKISLCTNY